MPFTSAYVRDQKNKFTNTGINPFTMKPKAAEREGLIWVGVTKSKRMYYSAKLLDSPFSMNGGAAEGRSPAAIRKVWRRRREEGGGDRRRDLGDVTWAPRWLQFRSAKKKEMCQFRLLQMFRTFWQSSEKKINIKLKGGKKKSMQSLQLCAILVSLTVHSLLWIKRL